MNYLKKMTKLTKDFFAWDKDAVKVCSQNKPNKIIGQTNHKYKLYISEKDMNIKKETPTQLYKVFLWDREAVNCRPCQKTKELIKLMDENENANVTFELTEYTRNSDMSELEMYLGENVLTLPQVMLFNVNRVDNSLSDPKVIGGFSELKEYYHEFIDNNWK